MPLSPRERDLVRAVDRLKILLLLTGSVVLVYLLFTPPSQLFAVTSIMGVTLCALFWVTHQLLTLIAVLDIELTKMIDAVKKALPEDARRKLLR